MPFGGQGTGCDFSPSDNVVDPASPMMAGIPNPMEGNSASHLSYTGLPVPAHTVVVNPPTRTRCFTICNSAAPAAEHHRTPTPATISNTVGYS